MKGLLAVAMSLTLGTSIAAQQDVRVFVTAAKTMGGFGDAGSKDRLDSMKDLRGALDGRDGIVLVENGETADLEIEVIGRENAGTGNRSGTSTFIPLTGQVQSSSRETTRKTVYAILRVGDYEEPVEGRKDVMTGGWLGRGGRRPQSWLTGSRNGSRTTEQRS